MFLWNTIEIKTISSLNVYIQSHKCITQKTLMSHLIEDFTEKCDNCRLIHKTDFWRIIKECILLVHDMTGEFNLNVNCRLRYLNTKADKMAVWLHGSRRKYKAGNIYINKMMEWVQYFCLVFCSVSSALRNVFKTQNNVPMILMALKARHFQVFLSFPPQKAA